MSPMTCFCELSSFFFSLFLAAFVVIPGPKKNRNLLRLLKLSRDDFLTSQPSGGWWAWKTLRALHRAVAGITARGIYPSSFPTTTPLPTKKRDGGVGGRRAYANHRNKTSKFVCVFANSWRRCSDRSGRQRLQKERDRDKKIDESKRINRRS